MRVHYTSRLVRGRPDDLEGPGIIITTPTPPDHRRFGVVVPVEGNRWLVMLGGFHGEQAPTDPEGYQRYADGLPNTRIADLLHQAEPLTDPVAYTYPASRRRHFERLRRTPEGYLTIGDAMCSFNPVYAQGMTVAVLEAITLGECLDRYRSIGAPMTRAFYHHTGKLVKSAWNMATTADFAYTGTQGRKPPGFALAQWYQRQLLRATHVSPEVVNTVVRVEHLITPGSALLRPTMIVRVLRAARHDHSPGESPRGPGTVQIRRGDEGQPRRPLPYSPFLPAVVVGHEIRSPRRSTAVGAVRRAIGAGRAP
jgi:hypothetical protein